MTTAMDPYANALAALRDIRQAPDLPEVRELGAIESALQRKREQTPAVDAMIERRAELLTELATKPAWLVWQLAVRLAMFEVVTKAGGDLRVVARAEMHPAATPQTPGLARPLLNVAVLATLGDEVYPNTDGSASICYVDGDEAIRVTGNIGLHPEPVDAKQLATALLAAATNFCRLPGASS